jgi:hypothetical protein
MGGDSHSHSRPHGWSNFNGPAIDAVERHGLFYGFLRRFPLQSRIAIGSVVTLAASFAVYAIGTPSQKTRPVGTLGVEHRRASVDYRRNNSIQAYLPAKAKQPEWSDEDSEAFANKFIGALPENLQKMARQ